VTIRLQAVGPRHKEGSEIINDGFASWNISTSVNLTETCEFALFVNLEFYIDFSNGGISIRHTGIRFCAVNQCQTL